MPQPLLHPVINKTLEDGRKKMKLGTFKQFCLVWVNGVLGPGPGFGVQTQLLISTNTRIGPGADEPN